MTTIERKAERLLDGKRPAFASPCWNEEKEEHLALLLAKMEETFARANKELGYELYTDTLSVGCDPEFLLRQKNRTDGVQTFVSAHDKVPGNKQEPHWFDHGLGSVQSDGTAVEIGIKPATSAEDFEKNMLATLASVLNLVGEDEYDLVAQSRHVWSSTFWNSLPDDVTVIGCSPAFSNYNGIVLPTPRVSEKTSYFGGHIHLGFRNPDMIEKHGVSSSVLEKENLCLLGVLDNSWYNFNAVTNGTRNEVYGQAHRPKSYGFEWRTPSSYWLSAAGEDRYRLVFYNLVINFMKIVLMGRPTRMLSGVAEAARPYRAGVENHENSWNLCARAIENTLIKTTR